MFDFSNIRYFRDFVLQQSVVSKRGNTKMKVMWVYFIHGQLSDITEHSEMLELRLFKRSRCSP